MTDKKHPIPLKRGYSRFINFIHFSGDLTLLNFAFFITYLNYIGEDLLRPVNDHYVFLHLAFNLVWGLLVMLINLYDIKRVIRIERVVWDLIKATILHALVISAFIFFIQGYYYSRVQIYVTYAVFAFLILVWRLLFLWFLQYYRKTGSNFKNVVIVGAGGAGNQIYQFFKKNEATGYRFVGFFDDKPEKSIYKDQIVGRVSDLLNFSKKTHIDEIFCALPLTETKKIRELMTFADNHLIRLRLVPDFRGFYNKKVNIEFYDQVPVLSLRPEPLESLLNRFVKRSFDILFSGLVIVLVFPWLFPILFVMIKLSSPGPVFFKQKRSGRDNSEFYLYKFRSMQVNRDSDSKQATAGDPRVTRVGKFLRKSNFDELPQFFNVLMGNMSIVGPRPHMLKHTVEYSRIIDKFMVRHLVKPGITGWAQVNGFRGATTDPRYMLKRVRYDLWYIENWSFLLDLKIIFLTVYNMFKGEKNAV
ncbi:undecaprenyl-phosphate glucose phosphotransferase [Cytophagaceae bacterium ABcell3]|nr:undecaprenyl-phosphate glucose phosphotransferase [Cytophagaceae bacterium ABcell3]